MHCQNLRHSGAKLRDAARGAGGERGTYENELKRMQAHAKGDPSEMGKLSDKLTKNAEEMDRVREEKIRIKRTRACASPSMQFIGPAVYSRKLTIQFCDLQDTLREGCPCAA